MSRTSSSFLIPFLMTLVVTLAIGMSWLYFGYYNHTIATYTELALNGQDPAVETTFMDTDNPELGDSELTDALDNDLEDPGSEKKPADPAGDSKDTLTDQTNTKSDDTGKYVSPIHTQSQHPPSTKKTSRKQPPSASSQQKASRDNTKSADRKPAFPSSRNDSEPKKFSGGTHEEDNPLLRALKQAGERQNDPERKTDSGDPPQNPFDFLLNKEQQTE